MFGELPHGHCRITVFRGVDERGVEQFGEQDDIRLVIADGVDEEFNLLQEVVKGEETAHLPLHNTDSGDGLGSADQLAFFLITE